MRPLRHAGVASELVRGRDLMRGYISSHTDQWKVTMGVDDNRQALGWRLWTQIRLIRAARHPEFRIAILGCMIWLLFVQAYQPWRYSRAYQPRSILELPSFFFGALGLTYRKADL